MNPSRPRAGMSRFLRTAACGLAQFLMAATLPAQYYAPQYYAPQPQQPYYAPAGYPMQSYAMPTPATPAAYRIPMLSAHPGQQYCPPGYQPGYGPYPQQMQPGQMQPQPGQMPQQPGQMQQPGRGSPSQTPGQTDSTTQPQTNQQPQANQQQQQQTQQPQSQNQQDQQQNPLSPSDFSQSDTGSRADPSPGMNTPQLGRNDQTNRLNLFDNMAAAPQSRAWFGFQYADGFDTGLQLTDAYKFFLAGGRIDPYGHLAYTAAPLNPDVNLYQNQGITTDFFQYNQRLYRVGGEWAVTNNFSVAVQGQYYSANGDGQPGSPDDNWTNPQILTKLVVARDSDTILTATMGITPETGNDIGDINENVTRLYPGFLFYEGLTPNLFAQGGAQIGLPTNGHNEVYHTDWSLALGYWLYRDPCPCGPGACDRPHFLRSLKVTGIIPQVNLLGKHTLGNNKIIGPFGFDSFANQIIVGDTTNVYDLCDPITGLPIGQQIAITTPVTEHFILPEGFVNYREPRDILDLTIGSQVLFGNHVQVGLGYSFPLTGNSVRQNEFISTFTYLF